MAAPNIVAVANIMATTNFLNTTSSTANVVANPSGSGTVVKVNTVMVANYSSSSITANVDILRNGTGYLINGTISVPANSTLVSSGKDTAFYLIEGDVLRANTSANATCTVSYEIIS